MAKFLKDRYFWFIVIFLGIDAIIVYPLYQYYIPRASSEFDIGLLFETISNSILAAVVAMAAWRYKFKGGLVVVVGIEFLLLPHIMGMFNPLRIGHLSMYVLGVAAGISISWLVSNRKQAGEDTKTLLDRETEYTRKWQQTFDAITDIVCVISLDCKFLRMNKAGCKALGMKEEELIGRKCYELVHGTSSAIPECPCEETLRTKKVSVNEYLSPQGRNLLLTAYPMLNKHGEMVSFTHVVTDITDEKKIQKQLMLQDRLASIGQLVSGVANEINNPLTSVIGFSDLVLRREIEDDVRADLKIVNDEAKRAALIVKKLLTFVRSQSEEKSEIRANEMVERVLLLRNHDHKMNNIQVITKLASNLPNVKGNASQLQQVLYNIIVNAEQAMLEANGKGIITVTTEQSGDTVVIRLADNGPGINQENMKKLFTPFFTTKELGKGTGLGLSICHGIVTEHGGKICAESKLGKGTTFIIELPTARRAG